MGKSTEIARSIQLESINVERFQPSRDLFSDDFLHISTTSISSKSFEVHAIVDREMSKMEDGTSLKKLIRTVYDALESATESCAVIDFNPSGCKWRTLLWYEGEAPEEQDDFFSFVSGPENYMDTHFCMYAACCEKFEGKNVLPKYTIDIALVPPKKAPNFIEKRVMEKHTIKKFENLGYVVKKAIIKLEFPKFPEGNSGKQFKKIYKLTKEMNSGTYAKVFRAMHRETHNVVAVKAIQRSEVCEAEDAAIMNEVSILSSLDHPQIIKVFDFFEEPEWYLIVMELMQGGDLFDKIANRPTYNEEDARNVCKKLLKAIDYCHQNGVAHLDLKTKNLLLVTADDDLNVKIGDFGFAERVTGPKSLTRQCGTPFYIAPEILTGEHYDEQADMWSIGVIIYLLLSGKLPFMAKSQGQLFCKIKKGGYTMDKFWENVSDEAKELVRNLLVTDPDKRWTATQALESAWFSVSGESLSFNDLHDSAVRLKHVDLKLTFKAAVHAVTWVRKLSSVNEESGIEEEEGKDSNSSSDSDS